MGRFYLFVISFIAAGWLGCHSERMPGVVTNEDAYVHYKLRQPRLTMQTFGDYWFHSLNKKFFPAVSTGFVSQALIRTAEVKPKFLFSAHTTILPYYFMLGMVYENATIATAIKSTQATLKTKFHASMGRADTLTVGDQKAIKFNYTIVNKDIRMQTEHKDYFVSTKGNVFRFLFWTSDSNENNFDIEADIIIRQTKF